MSLRVEIEDGRNGSVKTASVTSRGQLVTAPLGFNEPYFQSLTNITDAFNFIKPKAGKQFVIDGVIFSSDKLVSSTNGAQIIIFETDAIDSTTPTRELFRLDIARLDKGSISGLNMITTPSVWINAKTDDNNCNVTLLGYYVQVLES